MAGPNLLEKTQDAEKEEIFCNRSIYNNCEIRGSYNKEIYFARLIDSKSGEIIKEVPVPILEVLKGSKDEHDSFARIYNFVHSDMTKNFDIICLHSLANIYSGKK
ncbi:hypothetical protein J4433_00745 [Candidatus Pacearchaeota archaeon]|nr:hypothetical protein [Candidatus Pacearchaeota archaeon]